MLQIRKKKNSKNVYREGQIIVTYCAHQIMYLLTQCAQKNYIPVGSVFINLHPYWKSVFIKLHPCPFNFNLSVCVFQFQHMVLQKSEYYLSTLKKNTYIHTSMQTLISAYLVFTWTLSFYLILINSSIKHNTHAVCTPKQKQQNTNSSQVR